MNNSPTLTEAEAGVLRDAFSSKEATLKEIFDLMCYQKHLSTRDFYTKNLVIGMRNSLCGITDAGHAALEQWEKEQSK